MHSINITPFQAGVFTFCLGIFCADFFREYWVFLGVFFILIFGFIFQYQVKNIFWVGGIGMLGFLLGCIRLFSVLPDLSEDQLIPYHNSSIELRGIVDSFPLQKERQLQFYSQITHIKQNEVWTEIDERILVREYSRIPLQYGDIVEISGEIERPENFGKFNYQRYLEREDVYMRIKNAQITEIDIDTIQLTLYQDFWRVLFLGREQFENVIRSRLSFPENEYALGILLGSEAGIPKDILDDFDNTGLRHLLALSGFNITIILLFIFSFFFWLPLPIRIVISLVAIALFVGITGASSSVLRAAIMGGIGLWVLHSQHRAQSQYLVLITLGILALWNPFLLVSDPALQFSILAVLGLIYLVPVISYYLPMTFLPSVFREVLHATLAAQIFTLPLVIVFFEKFSLIAPIANVIVGPLTALSMLFAFLVTLPYIGIIMIPLAYIILHFCLFIAHILSDIPYAQWMLPGISIWWIIPMYCVIFFLTWIFRYNIEHLKK